MKTERGIYIQHEVWEIIPEVGDHLPQIITMILNDCPIIFKRMNDV